MRELQSSSSKEKCKQNKNSCVFCKLFNHNVMTKCDSIKTLNVIINVRKRIYTRYFIFRLCFCVPTIRAHWAVPIRQCDWEIPISSIIQMRTPAPSRIYLVSVFISHKSKRICGRVNELKYIDTVSGPIVLWYRCCSHTKSMPDPNLHIVSLAEAIATVTNPQIRVSSSYLRVLSVPESTKKKESQVALETLPAVQQQFK